MRYTQTMHFVLLTQIQQIIPDNRMHVEVLVSIHMRPFKAGQREASKLRFHFTLKLPLRLPGKLVTHGNAEGLGSELAVCEKSDGSDRPHSRTELTDPSNP